MDGMESTVRHKRSHAQRLWLVVPFIALAIATLLGLRLLTTSAAPAAVTNVSITGSFPDFAFSPKVITITTGTTVVWTNNSPSVHTVTSDPGSADPWDSGGIFSGGAFTRTFLISGTFAYHCEIHPSMHGTVIVIGPSLTNKTYLPVVLNE